MSDADTSESASAEAALKVRQGPPSTKGFALATAALLVMPCLVDAFLARAHASTTETAAPEPGPDAGQPLPVAASAASVPANAYPRVMAAFQERLSKNPAFQAWSKRFEDRDKKMGLDAAQRFEHGHAEGQLLLRKGIRRVGHPERLERVSLMRKLMETASVHDCAERARGAPIQSLLTRQDEAFLHRWVALAEKFMLAGLDDQRKDQCANAEKLDVVRLVSKELAPVERRRIAAGLEAGAPDGETCWAYLAVLAGAESLRDERARRRAVCWLAMNN